MTGKIDEQTITKAIIEKSAEDWTKLSECDVIIVGAGPAGLTAAKYLAENKLETTVFERKLSFGGGIGGGGMLFHKIVVQKPADTILREINCKIEKYDDEILMVGTAELIAKLASAALDCGARIILGVTVDDLVYSTDPVRVTGAVLQWTAVSMSGLHVDPLAVKAKAVVDCTGHDAEVLAIASRKLPELNISVLGEKSMNVTLAERLTVKNTGEVAPGLYVAGMATAAIYNTPRMGPIFSSMLLSGRKVAQQIIRKIKQHR